MGQSQSIDGDGTLSEYASERVIAPTDQLEKISCGALQLRASSHAIRFRSDGPQWQCGLSLAEIDKAVVELRHDCNNKKVIACVHTRLLM